VPAVQRFTGTDPGVRLEATSITVDRTGNAALRLVNANAFAVSGSVALATVGGKATATRREKKPTKPVSLGSAAYQLPASGRAVVGFKVSKRGRALLRHSPRLKATATITARDPAGTSLSTNAAATLKAAKKPKRKR
jgi:hypothetical protein